MKIEKYIKMTMLDGSVIQYKNPVYESLERYLNIVEREEQDTTEEITLGRVIWNQEKQKFEPLRTVK